jgi:hypothetical protein
MVKLTKYLFSFFFSLIRTDPLMETVIYMKVQFRAL